MSNVEVSALTILGFRAMNMLAGTAFAYIGYRLFMVGIFNQAGDVSVTWGDRKLLLKRAAPGTVFGLAGMVIIAIALFQHPNATVEEKESGNDSLTSMSNAATEVAPGTSVLRMSNAPRSSTFESVTSMSNASPGPTYSPSSGASRASGASDVLAVSVLRKVAEAEPLTEDDRSNARDALERMGAHVEHKTQKDNHKRTTITGAPGR